MTRTPGRQIFLNIRVFIGGRRNMEKQAMRWIFLIVKALPSGEHGPWFCQLMALSKGHSAIL